MRAGIETIVPFGLAVSELLSNSLSHAFPGHRSGRLIVSLDCEDRTVQARVEDDGVGFRPNVSECRERGLGIRLAEALASQLDGGLDIYEDGGGTANLRFPSRLVG